MSLEEDDGPPRPKEAGRPAHVAEPCNTGGVSGDEDRLTELAELSEQVALDHLGDRKLGDRLNGEDEDELRRDAERLREQANLTGTGRPSLAAAVFAHRADVAARNERVLGEAWSEKGAP